MKRLKNKKNLAACLAILSISILVLSLVYSIIDKKHPGEIQTKEEYLGDIETPAKKLLNGYLGVFFRFKQLGNINWLIIPLLIWFLTTKKRDKRERWHWALLFVWGLTVAFIGVKGYYNFRYQLTLFPLTSAMVLFLTWKFLEDKSNSIKILCFSFITLACLFNIYHYRDFYKSYWDLRVCVKNPHFPYKLINYLDSMSAQKRNSRVLTINQPIFYYHVRGRGLDYVGSSSIQIWVELKKKIGTVNSRYQLYQLLRKRFKVRYILLSKVHQRFHRSTVLEEFLNCECKLVMEDHGWLLYRLRNKSLEDTLTFPDLKQIKLWNDRIEAGYAELNVQDVSPFLLRFSSQGVFKFEMKENNSKNEILVRNKKARKGVKKRIHFGYEFNRKGLKVEKHEYEGMYVTFIVRTLISPSLLNRDNYVAIIDYNKDGSHLAEKTFFTTHHWRTYMVSKKIRPDNKRLLLMFRYCPKTIQDRFGIQDVRVVISKEPL